MEIVGLERGMVGNYQPAPAESISGIVVKVPLISILPSAEVMEPVFSIKWIVDIYGEDDRHLFSGYATKSFSLKLSPGEKISPANLFSLVRQVGDFFNEEAKRSDVFIPIRNLDYLLNNEDMSKAKDALSEEVERWNESGI